MRGILQNDKPTSRVVYTSSPSRLGNAVFSDVKLPDGTTIRRVDEAVRRKALDNANRQYRQILNAE